MVARFWFVSWTNCLGFGDLIAQHLTGSRRGKNTQLLLADLLRQSVYSRIAGYEDVNDAEGLAQDPTFRLTGSEKIWERGAALHSARQRYFRQPAARSSLRIYAKTIWIKPLLNCGSAEQRCMPSNSMWRIVRHGRPRRTRRKRFSAPCNSYSIRPAQGAAFMTAAPSLRIVPCLPASSTGVSTMRPEPCRKGRTTAKPEKGCTIQLFLKVAAPWGRGDLSAAASGYSISGFAIAPPLGLIPEGVAGGAQGLSSSPASHDSPRR